MERDHEGKPAGNATAPAYAIERVVPSGIRGAHPLRVVARDLLGNANASERGVFVVALGDGGDSALDVGEADVGLPPDDHPPIATPPEGTVPASTGNERRRNVGRGHVDRHARAI